MNANEAPAGAASAPPERPLVSVVMANWRGERYLAPAIASVLAQSVANLELLVADDASDDRSAEIVQAAMARDSRVRWLPTEVNAGPAAARNRALDAARGEWIAIMDSDDLVHPRRLELLIEAAGRFGADLVADDMAFFGDRAGTGGRTLLETLGLTGPMPVDAASFVEAALGRSDRPDLGYTKVVIRRAALGSLRYDPGLRVGEDYDLCLRLLLRGLRFVLVPLPTYLYRRHSVSLSHRLSVGALQSLIRAHRTALKDLPPDDARLARAMAQRGRMLERALDYEELVEAIKGFSPGRMAGLLARNPALIGRLGRSIAERASRPDMRRPQPKPDPVRVALLPNGAELPPEAGEGDDHQEALHCPDLALDRLDAAPRLVRASCRLTDLASRAPLTVTTFGQAGADLLGLLPPDAHAELWLSKEEASAARGLSYPQVSLRCLGTSA